MLAYVGLDIWHSSSRSGTAMGTKRDIPLDDRMGIIALKRHGISNKKTALQYHCSVWMAQNIWSRYNRTGNNEKLHRPGRRRKASAREGHRLILIRRQARFSNAGEIARQWAAFLGQSVSTNNVRGRLHQSRIFCRVQKKKNADPKTNHWIDHQHIALSVVDR